MFAVSKARARHLRPFPTGQRREMTDAWKSTVRAAMASFRDDKGEPAPMSPAQLAARLGVTRGLVSKFLRPIAQGGQVASALVPKVCELLHVGPPTEPPRTSDERRQRLDGLIDKMTNDQLEGAIRFLESLLKK
jgi:hypothetical protein